MYFHREITNWEELMVFFAHTFSFVDVNLDVHNALQIIQDVVLEIVPVAYPCGPTCSLPPAVDDGIL